MSGFSSFFFLKAIRPTNEQTWQLEADLQAPFQFLGDHVQPLHIVTPG